MNVDVIVIGSGFGGSVAALRFTEAGQRVLILERGCRVSRETFQADADMFWNPRRQRYGMNEIRARGRTVIPWLGSAVGGGSHVYAATLKRRRNFAGFPRSISECNMTPFYETAEAMLDATRYPDQPPYSSVRATRLLCQIGEKLYTECPEFVESWGRINLGISFAPPGVSPGTEFQNRHGAPQRYSDPMEQSLLGGDIGSKNSLDLNYLFRAEKLGARIEERTEVDRIEPTADGYRVHFHRHEPESSRWKRLLRRWTPGRHDPSTTSGSVTARHVVIAAGSIGSTELLLRNRDVHGTLPNLNDQLGRGYSTNGDYVTAILPFRGFFWSWGGLVAAIVGFVMSQWWLAILGTLLYALGLLLSRQEFDPDLGTTNSDFIRFRHRDGSLQGSYLEGGRYPTLLRASMAVTLSLFGRWRPSRYRGIVRVTEFLQRFVPPFELIARSWPIPLLHMGRDDAVGTMRLNETGHLVIDFNLDDNREYYEHIEGLGRWAADISRAWYIPNLVARLTRKIEVPHNLGGVPMGDGPETGVVDHAGRVFGHPDLMVLDGAIIPCAIGPNPALTILALAERGVGIAIDQLSKEGRITAETPA